MQAQGTQSRHEACLGEAHSGHYRDQPAAPRRYPCRYARIVRCELHKGPQQDRQQDGTCGDEESVLQRPVLRVAIGVHSVAEISDWVDCDGLGASRPVPCLPSSEPFQVTPLS